MQWQCILAVLAIFSALNGVKAIGNRSPRLSPILYITGYGGSTLTVEDSTDTHCNTNGEAVTIWVNATHVAEASDCFLRQFGFSYSEGEYTDPENVAVSTVDFGKLSSLADLLALLPPDIETNFVDYLVERGYKVDETLRAAPYDWRLGAEQLEERGYFDNVRQLIEEMYEENGNTKVTILAISMGGPVSHYFLTRTVTQEWKDMYIHSYIPIVGAWSGANGFSQILTPAPFNLFFGAYEIEATGEEIRDFLRTFPSHYYLLPHESVWKDTILVSTPSRNYTASDYEQMFGDAGYPEGYMRSLSQNSHFVPPNVPTHCFYGLGIPTPETFVYDQGFPDTQPSVLFGDGDGVVNKQSIEVCAQWANSSYPFNRTVVQGATHFTITTYLSVLRSIGEIVGAPVDPISDCPPLCTHEFCSNKDTRRALCTLPPTDHNGECESECRITYCHTCYYGDEHRPLPGDCDTCPYYPEVYQAVNRCFRRWAVCVRRANASLYEKARGRKERTQERFKCYEHPCL